MSHPATHLIRSLSSPTVEIVPVDDVDEADEISIPYYPSTPEGVAVLYRRAIVSADPELDQKVGELTRTEFRVDGHPDRPGSPTEVIFGRGDRVILDAWLVENAYYSRLDGPAWVVYDEDGSVVEEQWIVDGNLHRTDGPAMIEADGTTSWWFRGMMYGEEVFEVIREAAASGAPDDWIVAFVGEGL